MPFPPPLPFPLVRKFLFFSSIVKAQHFPPVGAVWKFDYVDGNFYPWWAPYYPKTTWSVVKDTLINGKICRKLVKSNLEDLNDSCGSSKVYFFYESSDSLFSYSCLDNKFHLYFNFNIKVGDTVLSNYVLQYIDSIVMKGINDSMYIKKYHLIETYTGNHGKIIYDKIFNAQYQNSINEYFPAIGIPEWSGWSLRCYSDSIFKELRFPSYSNHYSCDYSSYRPIQPPSQFGIWTYSLPRTSSISSNNFCK